MRRTTTTFDTYMTGSSSDERAQRLEQRFWLSNESGQFPDEVTSGSWAIKEEKLLQDQLCPKEHDLYPSLRQLFLEDLPHLVELHKSLQESRDAVASLKTSLQAATQTAKTREQTLEAQKLALQEVLKLGGLGERTHIVDRLMTPKVDDYCAGLPTYREIGLNELPSDLIAHLRPK